MQKLIRRCAQCRQLMHRTLLLRVRCGPGGQPLLGRSNDSLPGRSLYICPQAQCLQRAAGNKGLIRLLPGLDAGHWRQFCQQQREGLSPTPDPSPSS